MPPRRQDSPPVLLSRDAFEQAVFARDGHRCVACRALGEAGVSGATLDAHHLLNRRLWTEPQEAGGYFVENGVTLCGRHHPEAEATTLSAATLRLMAGITRVVLPRQLTEDEAYDTWGNVLLPNGTRLRGPLFDDTGCQRALAAGGALGLFTHLVKAPRIPHLPWSAGATADDARLSDLAGLIGEEVVVSEKLDGENTSLYPDFCHARSLAPMSHPSQSKLKALHALIARDIPEGFRVCVENLSARHAIAYEDLESLFPVTAIWNERNIRLPWSEMEEYAHLLGLPTAPVLYRGPFDEAAIKACYTETRGTHVQEGYVVTVARAMRYGEAARCQAKFVSATFRRALTGAEVVHWASKPVIWTARREESRWIA